MGSYMDRAGHMMQSSRDYSTALTIMWLLFPD